MSLKTVSSKSIIASIFNDYNINSSAWVASSYDWIGDAIQGIGLFANSIIETETICIEEHYGNLPCYVESIIAVYYNNARLPLGTDVSLYGIVDWNKNSKTEISPENANNLIKYSEVLQEQQDD